MPIPVNLASVAAFLKQSGFEADIQQETSQVFSVIQEQKVEFPLFARPISDSAFLQMVVYFPYNYVDKAVNDLARMLLLLNKELDVPGFGLDELGKLIYFRVCVPAVDGKLREDLLEGYLNTLKTICTTFAAGLMPVAIGQMTFQEMQAQADAAMQKMQEEGKA